MRRSLAFVIGGIIISTSLLVLTLLSQQQGSDVLLPLLPWFIVPVLGIGLSGILMISEKRHYEVEERTRNELKNEEKQLVQGLKQSDTDFATIWSLTQGRIDYYHDIATNQARRSFVSSQIATGAGFVLIIGVALIASQATSPVTAISVGAVGVVGGGLSAYIGATFMKSQTEATAQLRQFFLQPVEASRILSAERLLDKLEPEQKAEAVQHIIRSMMLPQSHGEEKKEP